MHARRSRASWVKSDGQPKTGPGRSLISLSVPWPASRWKRRAAVTSESRKVAGSRSSGPIRSHRGCRSTRVKASASPSVSTYPAGASSRVMLPLAASSNAPFAVSRSHGNGTNVFASNVMPPPRLCPRQSCNPCMRHADIATRRPATFYVKTFSSAFDYRRNGPPI